VCGIIGYVGQKAASDVLLASLENLEYRGYDSAGICTLVDGRFRSVRAVGNLKALRSAVDRREVAIKAPSRRSGTVVGIGHTRWATHGAVSEANAHPHVDAENRVHVVVNGIVENYIALKRDLVASGAVFSSETDAEVIAHLVARQLDGDGLVPAVRRACSQLRGHYAFLAVAADYPDLIVGSRRDCPLIVGRGDGEQFVASALPAFLAHTRRVQAVENDEIVGVHADRVDFIRKNGRRTRRAVEETDADPEVAQKGGYETFMLKEIHEQPDGVAKTLVGRLNGSSSVQLSDMGRVDDRALSRCRRVVVVGCGTSYHAGLIARYALERWLRIPVDVEIASEYRYRDPVVGPSDLVVGISQSGETADTLAAMRLARDRGARVLAVTNVMGSRATCESDGVLFTRGGIEIGVAATKTFTAQLVAMQLLGLRMAELRDSLPSARRRELLAGLGRLSGQIDELLSGKTLATVARLARKHHEKDFFLYLGRQAGLGVALEGALKLKEISYIATDAYAAGEMKHGPIALLSEGTPVITIATDSPFLDKLISNMQQVKARGATVIAVATEGNHEIAPHADEVLWVPRSDWELQPALATVPLQLLAYRIARHRGLNVDQPRNLAKTVTVE
jgi:glutamine---fructose-6-phosphate transaminase (isomerizing)